MFSIAWAGLGLAAPEITNDLHGFLGGREGCFVLFDSQSDSYLRHNSKGCAERFSPRRSGKKKA